MAKKTILRTFQVRIVMRLVYLPANQPAKGSSHHHVRRKMLAACDPADADGCGSAIHQRLRQSSRIFMSNHRSNRPTQHRVPGWKRRTAKLRENPTLSIRRGWSLPLEGQFQTLFASVVVHPTFPP